MNYVTMTLDEINALSPMLRNQAKVVRAAAREAALKEAIGTPPNDLELALVDAKLGAGDRDEAPIYVKDNYATKYTRDENGVLVATRGDRRVKPVSEASFKQIDGCTSTRQDGQMNRFLQSGGVDAEREAKKWRFIVMQTRQRIHGICLRYDLQALYDHVFGNVPSDAYKELSKKAYKIKLTFDGQDHEGPMKDASGKRVATTLGYMIEGYFEAQTSLRDAENMMDHTPSAPKRIID